MIEDTKPAGFDERIEVTTDWEELIEEHEGTDLYYFIYHATSKELRGKWCMDAATSLEEAARGGSQAPGGMRPMLPIQVEGGD